MSVFQNKVAVVTGSGSGIGRALCHELAARGALVVCTDHDAERARQLATELKGDSERVDVTSTDMFRDAMRSVISRHGRIDYLFNNAGLGVIAEVKNLQPHDWERVIGVNLLGTVNGVAAVYGAMTEQGQGHIINFMSIAGVMPAVLGAPYGAAKAAVHNFTTTLSVEAKAYGVHTTLALPGYVESNIANSSKYRGITKEQFVSLWPGKPMPASQFARRLLDGVEKRRAIVFSDLSVRLMWLMFRYLPPALGQSMAQLMLKKARALTAGASGALVTSR